MGYANLAMTSHAAVNSRKWGALPRLMFEIVSVAVACKSAQVLIVFKPSHIGLPFIGRA
jgi:hypothetical protein